MNPESTRIRTLLCSAAVLALPALVHAQASPSGGGVWWEVSASAGGARLTCGLCDPTRELGPAVDAAVGAYANDRVRVGIEGGGWTAQDADDGNTRETVYRAGLVAQLHPRPASGLHVLAGIGWSGYRTEETTYDAVRLTLGAGWDLPLTASWVVGNRITLDGSSYAALKNGDAVAARSVGLSVLRFGVYLRKR